MIRFIVLIAVLVCARGVSAFTMNCVNPLRFVVPADSDAWTKMEIARANALTERSVASGVIKVDSAVDGTATVVYLDWTTYSATEVFQFFSHSGVITNNGIVVADNTLSVEVYSTKAGASLSASALRTEYGIDDIGNDADAGDYGEYFVVIFNDTVEETVAHAVDYQMVMALACSSSILADEWYFSGGDEGRAFFCYTGDTYLHTALADVKELYENLGCERRFGIFDYNYIAGEAVSGTSLHLIGDPQLSMNPWVGGCSNESSGVEVVVGALGTHLRIYGGAEWCEVEYAGRVHKLDSINIHNGDKYREILISGDSRPDYALLRARNGAVDCVHVAVYPETCARTAADNLCGLDTRDAFVPADVVVVGPSQVLVDNVAAYASGKGYRVASFYRSQASSVRYVYSQVRLANAYNAGYPVSPGPILVLVGRRGASGECVESVDYEPVYDECRNDGCQSDLLLTANDVPGARPVGPVCRIPVSDMYELQKYYSNEALYEQHNYYKIIGAVDNAVAMYDPDDPEEDVFGEDLEKRDMVYSAIDDLREIGYVPMHISTGEYVTANGFPSSCDMEEELMDMVEEGVAEIWINGRRSNYDNIAQFIDSGCSARYGSPVSALVFAPTCHSAETFYGGSAWEKYMLADNTALRIAGLVGSINADMDLQHYLMMEELVQARINAQPGDTAPEVMFDAYQTYIAKYPYFYDYAVQITYLGGLAALVGPSVVGVEEQHSSYGVTVYAAGGGYEIRCAEEWGDDVRYIVSDLRGRLLARGAMSMKSNCSTAIWAGVDDSGKRASSGVYLVRVWSEKQAKEHVVKVVIAR
ncbi:MAG TPA: hypothetical protein P5571_12380 [Candidatus Krumholzibacteria bacterium]|nr:hypothetical protein [Candidatus Krumholzibacteria bacterium]HRX52157.1 hypothetical protein [Candidatus Krumholzibacteria bacterium]